MSSPHSHSSNGWEPPSLEELQRAIPKYEITALLGRGGMGAVYKGRQTTLDREVAIKLLPETLTQGADDLNYAARFVQEARAMARLDHPAIISVYDFGETPAGQLYFVMEFVDGMDIHQYLQLHDGSIPQEHAISIVAHVLDALDYAHNHGIVHRDIKPANILLNRDGRVKIADFGLAKRFGEGVDHDAPALTMSNLAVGTPDYVAPEAFDGGKAPDHRADLYAVGVMLYRMLVGKLPRGNFKPPSELRDEIDPRIDRVIALAMEPDPDERYGSAAAVRADLDEILSRPLPKVEEGDESRIVEAVVPVTSTVKAGRPPRSRIGPKGVVRDRQDRRSGKKKRPLAKAVILTVFLGLAAAAWWMLDRVDEGTQGFVEREVVVLPPAGGSGGSEPDEIARAAKEPPFENSLGMKFVPVPGTDVLFCIHETRYRDFETYAAENGVGGWWRDQSVHGYEITERPGDHPVMRTSWEDAQEFCAWLSRKEGRTYRLPTDEEWSLAAGLGGKEVRSSGDTPESLSAKVTGEYPWGTAWPVPAGAGNYSDQSRKAKAPTTDPTYKAGYIDDYDDGFPTTAPVMSFQPNRFGLYDLGGSVWEWVEDWFNEAREQRVVRGGSCLDLGADVQISLLSSFRYRLPPDARHTGRGFRVVLVPDRAATSATDVAATPVSPSPASAAPIEATKDKPFTNTLGMKFVPVPDTDVLFCIHETRYRDYAAYAAENPGNDGPWQGQTHYGYVVTERTQEHPAWSLSWQQAKAFCEWLSAEEGMVYRLPTDREWSYAAGIGTLEDWSETTSPSQRSSTEGRFPWGPDWPPPSRFGNYSDKSRLEKAKSPLSDQVYLENYDDGFPTTAPVMSFAPNELGIYDLDGNLMEWCEDRPWNDGPHRRILRGAWWADFEKSRLRLNNRNSHPHNKAFSGTGFRIVLELPEEAPPKLAAPSTPDGKVPEPFAAEPVPAASVPAASILPVQPGTAPVPASEIKTYNGHRYQFVPGALTWIEAKTKAESMRGHLVTITSKEENEWLLHTYGNLLTTRNRHIWLGAIEKTPESGWSWVTGEPFTPLGWGPGEPNGSRGGGGQAGHPFMLNFFSLADGVIGWNDSSTHFTQSRVNIGFLVEWDKDETPEESIIPGGSSPAQPAPKVLSSLPGLSSRLEAYLTARNSRLGGLAENYRNAVETRRSQLPVDAAPAVVEAFGTELAGIDRLLDSLKAPPADPVEAVQARSPGLPDLPESSPDTLETLRQTWTSESGKILDSLGEALRQSLKVLESELVRARELENARDVVAFRDSLPEISNTPFSASPDTAETKDSKVSQEERTIPEGAVEFEGHQYFIFKVPPRNWNEARAHCESLGGSLAIINSARELEFLAELKRNILGERSWAWLGGHMPEDEDTWYWLDGRRMSSRDPWDPKSEFSNPQPTEKFLVFTHLDNFSGHGVESGFVTGYICEWEDD